IRAIRARAHLLEQRAGLLIDLKQTMIEVDHEDRAALGTASAEQASRGAERRVDALRHDLALEYAGLEHQDMAIRLEQVDIPIDCQVKRVGGFLLASVLDPGIGELAVPPAAG